MIIVCVDHVLSFNYTSYFTSPCRFPVVGIYLFLIQKVLIPLEVLLFLKAVS